MIVVDLNLLLYAINRDAALHVPARTWWESCLSGAEPVGLAWSVVLGFLRISTYSRIFPQPLPAETAMEVMDQWLSSLIVSVINPGEQHWNLVKELLKPFGTAGNLTTDAHLAALSIEYSARLYSTDNDFSRFRSVRWVNPLELR